MLINISENLSVQCYKNQNHTQWICYEPLSSSRHLKRRPWQRVSGLMSSDETKNWLQKHYPDSADSSIFSQMAC